MPNIQIQLLISEFICLNKRMKQFEIYPSNKTQLMTSKYMEY